MAGIGFVLRKLAREDNLFGILRAYSHAALASSGPWLFTICALGLLMLINSSSASMVELFEFRLLIIYNFSFSLVTSAPIYMISTRYLADAIHRKDVSAAPGLLIAGLVLQYSFQLPIVVWFYAVYANLTQAEALASITNFMLISGIWMVSIFLTALKDFRSVTWSFALGVCVTILASAALVDAYGTAGMLTGFNIGMAVILFALMARIFAEYPYVLKWPEGLRECYRRYWAVGAAGLCYNIAVWVDKWIMWFSPDGEVLPNGLWLFSNYDSAMFLAYLTIVPAMAAFVFSVETNFYEKYLTFYRDIQRRATFAHIEENHRAMVKSLLGSARNFLILQGSIALVTILSAPAIFDTFGINYTQLGIFRFGVLGAVLHVFVIFISIIFSYFDHRKAALWIAALFMLSNAGFTLISLSLGFSFYGYGYFLSSLVTFVFAAIWLASYIRKLPYHTFITRNMSVQES